jgi:hypothetical protein
LIFNVLDNAIISGSTTLSSSLNVSGITPLSNKVGIYKIPTNCNLDILGVANIILRLKFMIMQKELLL